MDFIFIFQGPYSTGRLAGLYPLFIKNKILLSIQSLEKSQSPGLYLIPGTRVQIPQKKGVHFDEKPLTIFIRPGKSSEP